MTTHSSLTINELGAGAAAPADRAADLFGEERQRVYRETDRLFVPLLLLEWIALIIVALAVGPEGWRQHVEDPNLRVWLLIALGGVVTIIPIALVRFRPGTALTRYTIAACQMFHSGILISLSGGRFETHFHVFCSLVILSLYRDWRVFIPATLVVALDHVLRAAYVPVSVYGAFAAPAWKSLEHLAWVIF